jgi:hypothetical protein
MEAFMADHGQVSIGRMRLVGTFATSSMVFGLIYLLVWAYPDREDGDEVTMRRIEPTFAEFACQGKFSCTVLLIALVSSFCASMTCYLVTWGAEDNLSGTVRTVVSAGIITAVAVGVALAVVHCFLVDFILINL